MQTQKLPLWPKEHRLVARLRELNTSCQQPTYATFQKAIEHDDPEICANAMITLIKICTYLLKQQIKTLETAFVNEGGLRERMTKARIEKRNKKD